LNIRPAGIYVDVTFGGGGHSKEILKKLNDKGRLIAFDQDADAVANRIDDPRFTLIEKNFSSLKSELQKIGIEQVDGILADLGISSHQIDEAARGFSTRFEGPLDMRMDRSQKLTAADVVNEYEEHELKRIFRTYGDIDNAGRLTRLITLARSERKIKTITDLKTAIEECTPKGKEFRYLAKVFQALRIEVNQEMNALKQLLEQSSSVLAPGGRLVVISYHSLEDRMMKNFSRSGNIDGKIEKDFFGNQITPFVLVNRKPIVPSEKEIELNSRARSAKLRIIEKSVRHGGHTAEAGYVEKHD
jgi:16S rRNA (cytosine1402-N4)-methyltransferase